MVKTLFAFFQVLSKARKFNRYIPPIAELILGHAIKLAYGILPSRDSGVLSSEIETPIIVTLTSFPPRISNIWVTLESILRQSVKPSKIVLCLASEEFPNHQLPNSILRLKDRGLEIVFMENLKPHKKYFHARKEWPNSIIITADDDVIYPENWLQRLLESYALRKDCVHCYRAHRIQHDEHGNPLPYIDWSRASFLGHGPSHSLLPTGVSGVLYPPGSLGELTCNSKLSMELAPYTDDIWLHYMSILSDFPVYRVDSENVHWLMVPASQKDSLCSVNLNTDPSGLSRNDRAIRSMQEYFKIDFARFPTIDH